MQCFMKSSDVEEKIKEFALDDEEKTDKAMVTVMCMLRSTFKYEYK